ncbi:dipeptide ABC transporter ATP-binding protein [Actinopolymorpha pittospori]|uniref:Peptide/nickel transport system ATP-binding protein n=1 Tax=Actinopolymorpha pittospori TaxID=648752 RepID=A0A927MS35_9ACTN|nr:ABC transporter ATP-binding protein [Actinopolymorpha pittospori]MBE1605114.1 peptide/nickel transport system ATP-binding protein [Actinopolymorpha pittospori]
MNGGTSGVTGTAGGNAMGGDASVVSVRDLRITFSEGTRTTHAVDGLSFDLAPGGGLGLVGESGSGKTVTALTLLGLHHDIGAQVSGEVDVTGVPVLTARNDALRKMRGAQAAMIFQDPLSALDPYYRVGDQISEIYRLHTGANRRAARERALDVLNQVHIPDPKRRVDAYPHELSGGMRQRALIAMALSCEPRLLVADEPTTALDVTVQAQILDLLAEIRATTGMALILVTHDLGVVAGSVDEVLVMSAGREVERGAVAEVLGAPTADYTRRLLAAVPRVDVAPVRVANRPTSEASTREAGGTGADGTGADGAGADGTGAAKDVVMSLRDLHRHFEARGATRRQHVVRAVDGVSLELYRGEVLGVVGESGSGKTTLSRMMVGLLRPTSGSVLLNGTDLARLSGRRLREHRREIAMVFQDPASSLNPRRSVGDSIAEPLRVRGAGAAECRTTVRDLLVRVGLHAERANAYPHEFSGGQRQRIGLARALATRPAVLVCDEPVSALDVTTQAQVLELIDELRTEFGFAVVFVSHDLAVVRQVSDRVAVMQRGQVVELADADVLYEDPRHPYTRDLLAAVPVLDPALARARREERRALA